MTVGTKIVDKIRKLLALSESPNQHEAELAAAKVSELLEKHQLSMTDIDVLDTKAGGAISDYQVVGKMKLLWIIDLARGCAVLFDAECLGSSTLHKTGMTFVGTRDDVEMAKALFQYLYTAWPGIVEMDLAKAKMESPTRFEPRDTMKFKAGHGLSYAWTIQARCRDMARSRKKSVRRTTTGTELMVLKDAMIKEKFAEIGVVYGRERKQSYGSSSGQRYGREAGRSARLSRELSA